MTPPTLARAGAGGDLGRPPLVRLRGIGKTYPGVRALQDVDLDLVAGEIHSIVGENGAGKSTLVRILAGLEQPDVGAVAIDGRAVRLRGPRSARAAGVSYVPQEAEGVERFSVGRSLLLGRESAWTSRSRLSPRESEQAREALGRMGIRGIALDTPVSELSIAELRLVQIAGALSHPGRLLLLDEPTAVLSDADAASLLDRLESLRAEEKAILYVSHRLGEVMRISDRITVLRDGAVVGSFGRGEIDRAGLLSLMARVQGETLAPTTGADRLSVTPAGPPVLRVRGLTRDRAFRDVDLDVAPGQVVGIAGIQGSGHGRLLNAIAGALETDRGEVAVDGVVISDGSARSALRAGVRLVPEERRTRGVVGCLSITDNIGVGYATRTQQRYFRRMDDDRATAAAVIDRLSIHAPGTEARVETLSGGNQQKVVIGRALESRPRVLLLCEPTQGVDVRSKAEILRLVRTAARETGLAVVLASSEFEELIDYTDVIHVMRSGEISLTARSEDMSYARLLEAAVP